MTNDQLAGEIFSLAGETLAFQAVLVHVLREISKADPAIHKAISDGFDKAANFVEDFAISRGKAADSRKPSKPCK